MEKVSVKICMGTTCFVMGASNLQELMDIVPVKYGDKVEISGVTCLGRCSDPCDSSNYSSAPYVMVNDEVVDNATVEKVLSKIERILENE